MKITRKSSLTQREHTMEVPCTQKELDNFNAGMYIQNAMPNVSAELREFVLSGITPEECNSIKFGIHDNDDVGDDDLPNYERKESLKETPSISTRQAK